MKHSGNLRGILYRLLNKVNRLALASVQYLPAPIRRLARSIQRLFQGKIIRRNRQLLEEILQSARVDPGVRTTIIFPPSLDWNVQLFQRPQQLALALARQGALVFYIQPKPDRKQIPFKLLEDRMYLCDVSVETFKEVLNPYIYLLTWNSAYATAFSTPRIVYDYVDDINVFYGDQKKIAAGHRLLMQTAAIVLATARKLCEEAYGYRPDVIYSPNGVDYENFAVTSARIEVAPPPDMQVILTNGKPVIGYYGALARWFDYELLKETAALRPAYDFVLIGPDYDGTLPRQNLDGQPNIHWLGAKTYPELPSYLRYFDAAIIPFLVNDITHAVSPLKLFEYMAAGKPVVITPMQESMQYPGVLTARGAEAFATQLDLAISLQNDGEYIKLIKATARENTWEHRAEEIIRRIETLESK